jgi:hypothetical protein
VGYIPENSMQAAAQKKGQATAIIFRAYIAASNLNSSYIRGSSSGAEYTYVSGSGYRYTLYYYNGYFYYTLSSLKSYNSSCSGVTSSNYKSYGIKKYKYGLGYYLCYIKHQDNGSSTVMGPMEYSIVRNNAYDITINKMSIPPYTDDDFVDGDFNELEDIETSSSSIQATTKVSGMTVQSSSTPIGE